MSKSFIQEDPSCNTKTSVAASSMSARTSWVMYRVPIPYDVVSSWAEMCASMAFFSPFIHQLMQSDEQGGTLLGQTGRHHGASRASSMSDETKENVYSVVVHFPMR